MARRRKNSGSVSFFSFQDILIGTIGIVLMMTIILVLLIGSEFAIQNSLPREDTTSIEDTPLLAEVDSLRISVEALETRISVDRTLRRLQLREAMIAAQSRLKTSRADLESKRDELTELANAADIDERALRTLELMKTRDQLRETFTKTRLNQRVTYQVAKPGDLEPIILEISRSGISIASTDQFRSPLRLQSQNARQLTEELISYVKALPNLDSRYLLFVIKPSGIALFRYLNAAIRNDLDLEFLERGYDLLPESHSISDGFSGVGRS